LALTNMKRAKEKTEAYDGPSIGNEDDYPYGLQISLDEDSLKKLGMDVADFTIGGKIDVVCQVEVTHMSESAGQDGDYSDVSLQITDMAMMHRPVERKLKDVLGAMKGE